MSLSSEEHFDLQDQMQEVVMHKFASREIPLQMATAADVTVISGICAGVAMDIINDLKSEIERLEQGISSTLPLPPGT